MTKHEKGTHNARILIHKIYWKSSHITTGEIYKTLGNEKLSKKILDSNSRLEAINSIKDKLTGIYKIT